MSLEVSMNNIKFNYLYRDGSNFKSWGEVIFSNPENLSVDQIEERLTKGFLTDKLFIASQISIPEVFLFNKGQFSEFDHCFHEFDYVEICMQNPTDGLHRSITDFYEKLK
jgi:hypothetical protein